MRALIASRCPRTALTHRGRSRRAVSAGYSLLPANLVASFVKRLSRLSLAAPAAAVVMLIPFTYNMLRRHPALMSMIHRSEEVSGPAAGKSPVGACMRLRAGKADGRWTTVTDGFNADEENPTLTNALESSLWELYSHRGHYHASVSTLAKIFEEAFTRPSYAMEDFLDHTYGTVSRLEIRCEGVGS